MKTSNFFWGAFFLSLGVYFLFNNIGLIQYNYNLAYLYQFWPLIFIFWGLGILNTHIYIKRSLSAISGFLVALIIISLIATISNSEVNCEKENVEIKSRTISNSIISKTGIVKTVDFQFDCSASEVMISGKSKSLLDINSSSTLVKKNYEINDDIAEIYLKFNPIFHKHTFSNLLNYANEDITNNQAQLSLDTIPFWNISINSGASELFIDLANNKVNSILLDAGMSDITIKIGNKQRVCNFEINCGFSSITIQIPKEIGCKIEKDNAFSSIDLTGFKNSSNENIFIKNQNALEHVNIITNSGFSSIEIETY